MVLFEARPILGDSKGYCGGAGADRRAEFTLQIGIGILVVVILTIWQPEIDGHGMDKELPAGE